MTASLRVLTWPDYALRGLISLARERLEIEVEWSCFDRNEEAFGLVAFQPDRFDVIFADGTWPRRYLDEGLVAPLDPESFAGWPTLEPACRERCLSLWTSGERMVAAYPAFWGVRGLIVDADAFGEADSRQALWDAPAGTAWVNSQGFEVIAEVALLRGHQSEVAYALDELALGGVGDQLNELAGRLGGVWRLLPDLIHAFAQGAIIAEVHSTSLAENVRAATGRDVRAVVPREGTVAWVDRAMIATGASDVKAAAAFIDLALSPDGVGVQWQESDGYWSANAAAMATIAQDQRFAEKMRPARAAAGLLGRCATYQAPSNTVAYSRVWDAALDRVGRVPASVRTTAAMLAGGLVPGGLDVREQA
ncbi:MAG: ABC transporter substrate-binding protein [Solirubrobacteraceae bacterium]